MEPTQPNPNPPSNNTNPNQTAEIDQTIDEAIKKIY